MVGGNDFLGRTEVGSQRQLSLIQLYLGVFHLWTRLSEHRQRLMPLKEDFDYLHFPRGGPCQGLQATAGTRVSEEGKAQGRAFWAGEPFRTGGFGDPSGPWCTGLSPADWFLAW